jgi:hypothetical protein
MVFEVGFLCGIGVVERCRSYWWVVGEFDGCAVGVVLPPLQ